MSKTWLIASREYTVNLRRPGFLIATFGAPLFSVGLMVLIFAVISSTEDNPQALGQVGFVDHAAVVVAEDSFLPFNDEKAAQTALEAGEMGAYFVIGQDYLTTGDVSIVSMSGVPKGLEDEIKRFLVANLAQQVDSSLPVKRLENPVKLTVRALDRGVDLGEEAAPALFMVPILYALVFFISTQTTSGYLMSSVVEEKSNRVMEILITSVTPLQLLFGKIIGLGALGLTQLVIWLGAGLVALQVGQGLPFLDGVQFPLSLVLIGVAYFFVSYFLFAGVMAGLGSISNTEQESRQFAGIFVMFGIAPFIFFPVFILNPGNPIAVALTLVPFTAPMSVLIRLSLGTIPVEQLIASFAILTVTAVVVIIGSARVFRWSLLMYGKRPTPREFWRVIRGRPESRTGTMAKERS